MTLRHRPRRIGADRVEEEAETNLASGSSLSWRPIFSIVRLVQICPTLALLGCPQKFARWFLSTIDLPLGVCGEARAAFQLVLDRRRWRQPFQLWRHNVAHPRRFSNRSHREKWSRSAAICDTARIRTSKASFPALRFPALQPSL